jgi:hypothetical protein
VDPVSVNENQTSLGEGVPNDGPQICAWCGEPSVDEIILEPDRYKFVDGQDGKKIKVLRKKAIKVKVCAYHLKNLKMKRNGNS